MAALITICLHHPQSTLRPPVLMAKRKWCFTAYDYARARTYYAGTRNNLVYVPSTSAYLSVYRALPRTEWIFLVFEASFLEAPWAVLFHATAIHCHYGIDIKDSSFFVLEWVLQICPKFKVPVSQKRSKNGRASWTVTKKVLKTKSW